MVWYGLAAGVVVGGQREAENSSNTGLAGSGSSGNKDSKGGAGAQGLFSAWGHEIWLYIGGIMGFGEKAGVYLTTGPMIGVNPDWAVGGGVHVAKRFGLGLVVPIRQALIAAAEHDDKLAYVINSAYQSVAHTGEQIAQVGQSALEQMVQNPAAMVATGAVVGICATAAASRIEWKPEESIVDKVKRAYGDAKYGVVKLMYGL